LSSILFYIVSRILHHSPASSVCLHLDREEELTENDTELTHLRVCLKAVEMQLPPHPDRELQRCFAVFKDGYRAIKKKRAARSNMVSHLGYDTSIAASSPAR
jgi:hypothetical protein